MINVYIKFVVLIPISKFHITSFSPLELNMTFLYRSPDWHCKFDPTVNKNYPYAISHVTLACHHPLIDAIIYGKITLSIAQSNVGRDIRAYYDDSIQNRKREVAEGTLCHVVSIK